ncbi:hypothetical protein [Mesorhizobium sp. CA16]|uniref:hypothetical protein n=1 Tax=Mesorhizobium sp. CA16 TaxID=588496 RepID=UPI001CCF1456|nr:hypothetical protein [Mesorhizobium sp. CA16]MBZ9912679.1 hypothetical protein [Mesorhizobium sp. CA16]
MRVSIFIHMAGTVSPGATRRGRIEIWLAWQTDNQDGWRIMKSMWGRFLVNEFQGSLDALEGRRERMGVIVEALPVARAVVFIFAPKIFAYTECDHAANDAADRAYKGARHLSFPASDTART